MREIVNYPDPILTQVCRPFTDEEIKAGRVGDMDIRQLVDEMTRLMRTNNAGVGLAAPQVGLSLRLFIAEVPANNAAPLVFINPEISDPRGSEEMTEGCLSLPGVSIRVKRPQMIHIKAKNLNGAEFETDANGPLARICQHEFDHIEGILITKRGPMGIGNKNPDALRELERIYKRWQDRLNKK